MKIGDCVARDRGVVDSAREIPYICSGFRNGEGALLKVSSEGYEEGRGF